MNVVFFPNCGTQAPRWGESDSTSESAVPLVYPTRLITLAAKAKPGNWNHWLGYSRSKYDKPPHTAEETAKEIFLQSVIHHISENWSISKRCLPMDVPPFWSSKDQYHSMMTSSTEPNWKVHQAQIGVKSTLVARYELSTETVHIFMSSLSIRPEKQPERQSDEPFYSW